MGVNEFFRRAKSLNFSEVILNSIDKKLLFVFILMLEGSFFKESCVCCIDFLGQSFDVIALDILFGHFFLRQLDVDFVCEGGDI